MASQLTYHRSVLDLLGISPVLSVDRVATLDERERVCQTKFPASVREWFAVQNAEAVFRDHSNDDLLETLDKLGNPDDTRQGYLRVATENQAVVAWYVHLSEGEDPPVYHNNDDWGGDLSATSWQSTSVTFTSFIFDTLSSHRFGGWYSGMHWSGTDSLPNDATLDQLRGWFQQGPTTDVPGSRVYRFFTTRALVTIRSVASEGTAPGTAEWSIEAESPEALLDFGRKLWSVGTLAQTLKAQSCTQESRTRGEELLQRLRAENVGSTEASAK